MSLKTKNFKLYKYEDNDIADLRFLHDSMDTIDKGLTLDVGSSTGTGNNYVLNLGSITLSSANKGISFKFWADKNSTGAVTINGTYNLVKANGNPIKNIKENAPYIITYDGGTSFFLSSGGADESDSTTVGIDGSKVLFGETFIGSDGEIHTGKIRNRTAVNTTLEAGQSIILYSGYYKDKSTIKAETLATAMTNAGSTLTSADQLVSGIKAVDKNGNLITGTANKYKTATVSITGDATVTVPSGGTRLIACFASSTGSTNHGSACGFISFKISENNYMNFKCKYTSNSTTTALEPYTSNGTGAIKSCKLYAGRDGSTLTRTAYIIYE